MIEIHKQIRRDFRGHVDDWGLIAEKPWEGGDSACETFGALVILKWLKYLFFVDGKTDLMAAYSNAAEKLINRKSGLWRRHCARDTRVGTNYWASEWNRATRDNGTAAIIAAIEYNDRETLIAIYRGFKRRKWFCGNTFMRNTWAREEDHSLYGAAKRQPLDPTPTVPDLAIMLKAIIYRSKWVEKSTWFWDIPCCLVTAIQLRKKAKDPSDKGNHLNSWLRITFCYRTKPTWVSRLAYKLMPKDLRLERQFGNYNSASRKNPPMHLLVEAYNKYKVG